MQDMNVSIMGTCYDIRFVDEYPERLKGVGEYADGLFNRCNREIYILKNKDKDFTDEGRKRHMNRVLRHEIIHAYLEESGLSANLCCFRIRYRLCRCNSTCTDTDQVHKGPDRR